MSFYYYIYHIWIPTPTCHEIVALNRTVKKRKIVKEAMRHLLKMMMDLILVSQKTTVKPHPNPSILCNIEVLVTMVSSSKSRSVINKFLMKSNHLKTFCRWKQIKRHLCGRICRRKYKMKLEKRISGKTCIWT